MRFMVLVPASEESEAGFLPDEALLAKMGRFNEEMVKAGVMLAGEGLHATSKGARIMFTNGEATARDGPFSTASIAGYWLIRVSSKDEAIEWMKRAPFDEGTELELRQVFEADDFGAALTPDLRARENELRATIDSESQATGAVDGTARR